MKMGVGTNIQKRAVHLVDMDAPWRPADVEQRRGRIVRQGNQYPEVRIGLFQGMFEKDMLTFNPGWNQNAEAVDPFTDVRDLQRELKAKGTVFHSEADEGTTGPANFIILDPDGNPVLVDQHV